MSVFFYNRNECIWEVSARSLPKYDHGALDSSVAVSVLDLEVRFQTPPRREIWFSISATPGSLAVMSTLTVHCLLEDETARERMALRPHTPRLRKRSQLIILMAALALVCRTVLLFIGLHIH